MHFIQLLQLMIFSFLLCFLKLFDLEKLREVSWYLDSLKMNLRFFTYVVQHLEALNYTGSGNIVKRSDISDSIL